ncbi:hypothetical protein [Burkholderia alba]|uniref:hypothetical protein n=1 Tax=Burkholderia alba TaxID=2683677 RepID=UPI002B05B819|nr:hypothetical protein [Burkholderia alba]
MLKHLSRAVVMSLALMAVGHVAYAQGSPSKEKSTQSGKTQDKSHDKAGSAKK